MSGDSRHLTGLKELNDKLNELKVQTGIKVLRQSVKNATTPAVQAMKLAVPVGTVAHRTYRKRLVAPGFLKRSIRAISFIRNGKAVALIGVRREAFYGINFVDRGTKFMSARKWFKSVFEDSRDAMEKRLADQLRSKIDKLTK